LAALDLILVNGMALKFVFSYWFGLELVVAAGFRLGIDFSCF
jgi:hypothetical protein